MVKADGLAAGKGVFVCKSRNEAIDAVQKITPRSAVRRGRQSARHRRAARRPRGQRAGDHRRPHDRHASARARSQGGLRRRHRPEHRRHGRLLPDAGRERCRVAADRRASAGADGSCHEAGAAAVPRRALCRADDDQSGAEGSGIQRPLRRSGMRAAADAVEERSGRRARSDRRWQARSDRAAGSGIRGRRCAS